MTDAEDARAIVESLGRGDHVGLDRQRLRGAVGLVALLCGCATPTVRTPTARMLFIVANPVAHGARLAASVTAALPDGSIVVSDHRLAEPQISRGADFPSLAARSLVPVVSPARLRRALRLRRFRPHAPAARSRLFAEYLFLAQSIRFDAAADALHQGATRAILVDYDRHAYTWPWVAAAKKAGVRVATLVHGTPNRTNYLPVLADDVLAWGEIQETWLRRNGVDATIHLVGRPDVAETRSSLRAPARLVISQSAEVLSDAEVERLRHRASLARAESMQVVLRLHPSVSAEHLDRQWRLVADACDVTTAGRGSLSDEVTDRDVVIVIESSSAMDAIAAGARAEVLADAARDLPADLEAVVRAKQSEVALDRLSLVIAIGDASRARVAEVLAAMSAAG